MYGRRCAIARRRSRTRARRPSRRQKPLREHRGALEALIAQKPAPAEDGEEDAGDLLPRLRALSDQRGER